VKWIPCQIRFCDTCSSLQFSFSNLKISIHFCITICKSNYILIELVPASETSTRSNSAEAHSIIRNPNVYPCPQDPVIRPNSEPYWSMLYKPVDFFKTYFNITLHLRLFFASNLYPWSYHVIVKNEFTKDSSLAT